MSESEVMLIKEEFDELHKYSCWFGHSIVYWNYFCRQYVIRIYTRKATAILETYFFNNPFKCVTIQIREGEQDL